MAATISFHNGTSVHRGHNRRDKWIADKESHIDPNGHFEIWHDEKLTDAYDRIFGQAVADYNAKQKRPDRKIGSYYEQIRQGNSERNMVYETIIGVYKSDASEETQREILRKVYEAWPKRYPQFEIVGAYYHADEEGEPHVHIDYVPVATGYKRGLAKQNGLVKALEQMGFVKDGKQFAIAKWQADGRELLDHICANYGIEIHHPQAGKGIRHIETQAYKMGQKLIDEMLDEIKPLVNQKKTLEDEIKDLQCKADGLQFLVDRHNETLDRVAEAEKELQNLKNAISGTENELANMNAQKVETAAEIENLDLERVYLKNAIPAARKELTQLREEIVSEQNTLQNAQNDVLSLKSKLDDVNDVLNKKIAEIENLSRREGNYESRVAQLAEDIPKLPEFIREWGNKLNHATQELLRKIAGMDDADLVGGDKEASAFPSFEEFREERNNSLESAVQQYRELRGVSRKPEKSKSRGGRSR